MNYFMQNKANFRRAQINASPCGKKDCEKGSRGWLRKNKPKQSQFPIILAFLNWLYIISFSIIVTAEILMESM